MHTRSAGQGDVGFTLVEVLTSVVIFGVMSTVAVGGMLKLARADDQAATTTSLVSTLRNAHERAVSEARTYCVQIDVSASIYRLRRGDLTAGTCAQQVAGPYRVQGNTRLDSATFATASGLPTVFFLPRGTASPGTVRVKRAGSPRVNIISVEGLTGRVSAN